MGNEKKIFGFGINDLVGSSRKSGENITLYNVWYSMIRRCYSEYTHKKQPAYIGCSVCDEWKRISVFKKWFDSNYVDGFQLDKDILKKGNKVYSPETCRFVPRYLNLLMIEQNVSKKGLPRGVKAIKNTNGVGIAGYTSTVVLMDNSIYLGFFDTPEEAFLKYKEGKESIIKEAACDLLKDGKIDNTLYEVLINYQVVTNS